MLDWEVSWILLLGLVGYRPAGEAGDIGTAPIAGAGVSAAEVARSAVDPLPQAMVLTSIVIGLGLTALMVAMALRLHEKYGTFDMDQIRRLRG